MNEDHQLNEPSIDANNSEILEQRIVKTGVPKIAIGFKNTRNNSLLLKSTFPAGFQLKRAKEITLQGIDPFEHKDKKINSQKLPKNNNNNLNNNNSVISSINLASINSSTISNCNNKPLNVSFTEWMKGGEYLQKSIKKNRIRKKDFSNYDKNDSTYDDTSSDFYDDCISDEDGDNDPFYGCAGPLLSDIQKSRKKLGANLSEGLTNLPIINNPDCQVSSLKINYKNKENNKVKIEKKQINDPKYKLVSTSYSSSLDDNSVKTNGDLFLNNLNNTNNNISGSSIHSNSTFSSFSAINYINTPKKAPLSYDEWLNNRNSNQDNKVWHKKGNDSNFNYSAYKFKNDDSTNPISYQLSEMDEPSLLYKELPDKWPSSLKAIFCNYNNLISSKEINKNQQKKSVEINNQTFELLNITEQEHNNIEDNIELQFPSLINFVDFTLWVIKSLQFEKEFIPSIPSNPSNPRNAISTPDPTSPSTPNNSLITLQTLNFRVSFYYFLPVSQSWKIILSDNDWEQAKHMAAITSSPLLLAYQLFPRAKSSSSTAMINNSTPSTPFNNGPNLLIQNLTNNLNGNKKSNGSIIFSDSPPLTGYNSIYSSSIQERESFNNNNVGGNVDNGLIGKVTKKKKTKSPLISSAPSIIYQTSTVTTISSLNITHKHLTSIKTVNDDDLEKYAEKLEQKLLLTKF